MSVQIYKCYIDIGHFTIRTPLSGGKAGKGRAATSNFQVFNKKSRMIEKQFKFKVGHWNQTGTAYDKAVLYCRFEMQKTLHLLTPPPHEHITTFKTGRT